MVYWLGSIVIQIGNSDPSIRRSLISTVQSLRLANPNLNINLYIMDENPGSAAGFNFGLRNMMLNANCPWVLVVNSDIAFYPGVLKRISKHAYNSIESVEKFGLGFTSLCCGGEWSALVFTRSLISSVGYFDENFYPAYYEDDDFAIRTHHAGFKALKFHNTSMLHGEIDGSKDYLSGIFSSLYMAPKSDSQDMDLIQWKKIHEYGTQLSKDYIEKKWGISMGSFKKKSFDCKTLDGINAHCQTGYLLPFNNNNNSNTLASWTLDPDRRQKILNAGK